MKANSLYHHVRRFEALGLLRAVDQVVANAIE